MHPDCLNADWLPAGDAAVYVFDDAQLASAGWGLKRILFVYETLLELPVEIHRGPALETLVTLARNHDGVITVETPDPWLRERMLELRARLPLEILPPPAFVELTGRVDLKRFSRYWSKAEAKLLA